MGYKIDYGTCGGAKLPLKKRRFRKKWAMIGIFAGLLALSMLHSKARLGIRDAVLPGDEAVTAAALQELVADLQAGEDFSGAVTAFCDYIITESGT